MFAALGRFTYRFRRWIPPIGLAVVIGLSAWAGVAGGDLSQGGWQIEGSESAETEALLADRFGEQATAIFVIMRDPAGDAASAEFQDTVADAVAPMADDPAVDEIVTYADTQDARFLSLDGTATFALARLNSPDDEAVEDSRRLVELVEQPAAVEEMWITGVPVVYDEFNAVIEEDLQQAELISLPLAGAILLVVFGTLVGAGLPLLIAAFSLATTFAAIALLANQTDMSIFVTNLATMIGLALAIDYSLFLVSRFREELLHHDVPEAIERTMATVGKAVAVSGIAVAIGLGALTVFEASALRSMGVGGIVVVVATLLYGLTVLPSLLALLGHRVNRWKIPLPRRLRLVEVDPVEAERRHGHGFWSRVAARVMRRPVLIGGPILILLLIAGTPFLHIQLSTGGNLEDLPDTPAKEGFIVLRDEFPGGDTDPMIAAVTYAGVTDLADGGLTAERLTDLEAYVDELAALHDVQEVESVLDPPVGVPADQYLAILAAPAEQWPPGLADWVAQTVAGDTTKVTVFSTLQPDSEAGRGLVAEVREVPTPGGAEVGVTGLAARSADFMASFRASIPVAVAIVIGVTFIVLFLTFGSVFLPVKAVLMSLISITASFGALVWIFQDGNLSGLLGFEATGSLAAWLPILMFAILFGLSMDYEVLLLSRIRERWVATGDNTRSVWEGIGITGGIITGAALIMVVVFSAFALSDVLFLKAIGFSMALAVLIDATVVRGILVPAFMRVMGRWNWWAPAWLQRAVARLGLYEGPASAPPPTPQEQAPA
ncbi:MAG TPA: MMPL family transporter [Candidatus Limnocylindria bacterium]|jgi:RND superfamily putative drug exporter